MELVYPSQLQLSAYRPPLPDAQTKILPLPFRPLTTPLRKARLAKGPGPSTKRDDNIIDDSYTLKAYKVQRIDWLNIKSGLIFFVDNHTRSPQIS